MRILFTNIGWKPAYRLGGPIVSVAALAERLVKRGHEVSVFTTNAGLDADTDVPLDRPVDVSGVRVWYFRRQEPVQTLLPLLPYISDSMGFAYAPCMRAELDRALPGIDCVDTQSPFIYPAIAAAHAAFRHDRPLFYHQRGNLLATHLSRRAFKKRLFIALFERRILTRATTLVALNDAERQAFARWAPGVPCRVVPNGIDLPDPRAIEGAPARVREAWGIGEDAEVVLFLGRVHAWKRVDVLLEAFAALAVQHPRAVLVVAGDDEAGLEARWAAAGGGALAPGRVRFTGPVSGNAKSDLLARACIFCLPSRGEGFSMATLEAMAHGVPVVLTPECNVPEVATLGAGCIAEGRPEPFAAALSRLLAEPETRRRAGAAARAFASAHAWESAIDRLLDVYAEGIDRHRHSMSIR